MFIKLSFQIQCEPELNIDGRFEMLSGDMVHGFGEGLDKQQQKYYLVFSYKGIMTQ